MSIVVMDKKEEIVMKLVHYFITEQNYTPIVVNGVKNEIWLENNEGPYKIIRINSNYIHNIDQYKFDIFKIKNVMKQIKKKTLSFKMNALNIFLDLNDGVKIEDFKNIKSINIKDESELKKNKLLLEVFPSIKNKMLKDSGDISLLVNVTKDINKKTEKDNKLYESVFKPKKVIITKVIIGICVLLYFLSFLYVKPLGNYLYYLGANNGTLVKNGEIYRLITSAFLHANILHLLTNMYALYVIGFQLETFIGKKRFFFVYLVSAIGGNLLSAVLNNSFSVGASGAIFGLLGAMLYFGYHYRLYLGSVMMSQIIPLIIINILFGFMVPNIDNAAHIGGLLTGYLGMMAVGVKGKSTKRDILNGIITLLIYFIFMAYLLFF